MSYYGPQRGDYYGRGDPGFLSDLWRGVKDVGRRLIVGQQPIMPMPPTGFAEPPKLFPGGSTAPAGGFLSQHEHGLVGPPQGMNGCCPTGYHMIKTGPFAGVKCTKNRRMDVCNSRALRRAIRRVSGFEKLAKRTFSFTSRSKVRKRA